MKFEKLSSKIIYQGKVFNLLHEKVRYEDGRNAGFDIVSHDGAVAIIPMGDDELIWFVKQFRPAVGGQILELPAGGIETGEDPMVCAQRELREEIGMRAEHIKHLGSFYLAPGYSTEYMHIYLALGLSVDPLPQDEDEEIEIVKHSLTEIDQMVADGAFDDAKTLAGFTLLRAYLQKATG